MSGVLELSVGHTPQTRFVDLGYQSPVVFVADGAVSRAWQRKVVRTLERLHHEVTLKKPVLIEWVVNIRRHELLRPREAFECDVA